MAFATITVLQLCSVSAGPMGNLSEKERERTHSSGNVNPLYQRCEPSPELLKPFLNLAGFRPKMLNFKAATDTTLALGMRSSSRVLSAHINERGLCKMQQQFLSIGTKYTTLN